MKHRNYIGLEDGSQVLQRYLLKRAGTPEPGIVDEDVNAPVVGVYPLDKLGHSALVGDVEGAGLQAPRPQLIESVWIAAGGEYHIISGLQSVSGSLTDGHSWPPSPEQWAWMSSNQRSSERKS
jgi:hypothetical protein